MIVLSSSAQIPILYYDFDNNTTRTTFENLVEQYVNSGSGAITKVGGGTIAGVNGSGMVDGGGAYGKAISTNTWTTSTTDPGTAATKYYQFTVNTTNLTGLQVSFQAESSGGVNAKVGVLYSTNGTTFSASSTAAQSLPSSWSGSAYYFTIPSAADNQSTVTIRVYGYGFSSSTNTMDIDNLTVLASSQTGGTLNMLDMPALGKSLTAGGTLNVGWTNFTVTGASTSCTFVNDMVFNGAVSVASGATLDMGDNIISGSASFTANSGTHIKIGNSLGLPGNVQVTGVKTYSGGAIYEYSGIIAQVTGSGLPSSITGTLIINNSLGVTLSTATTLASGSQLQLTSGIFAATTLLTINSGCTITRSGGSMTATLTGTAGTINYTGNSKTVGVEFLTSLSNVNVNMTAGQTLTMSANTTFTGSLTLTSGTLSIGSNTLTLQNSIARNGTTQTGSIDASSGTVIMNGSSAQSIPTSTFSGNVKNLTINNASGVTLNSNTTISTALTLTSGNLDLNGTTLTLSGTISGTGKLKGSSSSSLTVSSSTTTVGTLNFDQTTDGTTNVLNNFTVNNSAGSTVTLGTKLNLVSVLTVSGGTLNLNAQNLVLKSSASNTASVANVTGTLSGASNVTVERYIPNDGRRYRIITPGVTTTTSIKANWMEGGMNTVIGTNVNPKAGYGTQITGSGGNTNGFDVTQTNSPSLYSYNATTQTWVAVTNTNGTLVANQPYLIFIRGDRSADMTAQGTSLPSSATILRATGTLVLGDQTASSLVGNGTFNLVSNPFPSAVNWSTMYGDVTNSTNFQNYYTYWDPKIGTRGAYVTVDNTGTKSNISANATTEVQPGQGFFVLSKSGTSNPSLNVKQSHKSSNNNVNVFRTASQMEQLSASLYFYDATNTRMNADGVLSLFDNSFNKDVDDDDVTQIANWDEDIAFVRNSKALSIEKRPEITNNDTLFLSIARLKVQQYEWQFDPANFSTSGLLATLVDNFTHTQQPIRLDQPTFISFNVTSDPASSAANRFYITFRTASVLPITLKSFTGQRINADNQLLWTAASEENFDHYEVEYSTDQAVYNKIAAIQAKGTASGQAAYSFIHRNMSSPTNYYRLKMVNKDASFTYSNIVFIKGSDINVSVDHIYPNPFTDELTVNVSSQAKMNATLTLTDMDGRQVRKLPVTVNPGFNSFSLQNLHVLGYASYILSVKGDNFNFSTSVIKAKN